ncbi:MAG: response regulator [Bacteroidales bacterium]|nr:response regulator [Bacteroidales bacterium]MBN2821300.1 response regulator [Bacteroidales bacterium]
MKVELNNSIQVNKKGIFVLVCLLFVNFSFAQQKQYMFKTISKPNGLSNNSVISFLRDSKGFIWIGTADGLNRFDGYAFKHFKYDPEDSTTIRGNNVEFLYEDYEGNIWIGADNYLEIYNPETGTIKHATTIFNGKLKFEYETKWKLYKDRFGHYWYSSSSQGLYRYFVAEDSLVQILEAHESPLINQSYRITGISEDNDGNIYSITNKGEIFKISGKTTRIIDSFNIGNTYDNFYKIFVDKDYDIWCFDQNQNITGLIYLNCKTGEITNLRHKDSDISLSSDIISSVIQDDEGKIWIGTDHGGINILDKKSREIQHLYNNSLHTRSLAEDAVETIYKDYEGFLWVGTFKKGLSYYHKDLFQFNHYKINLNSDEQITGLNDIDNFAEDKDGNLWIGTNGAGLIYYNRQNQTYKLYRHDPDNRNSISSNIIIGLSFDSKGNLWAGTYFGGLNKFDGQKFTHYKSDTTNPEAITDDRIWDVCEDSDGMLWIATLLGGVNVFNPETGKVTEIFRWLNENTIRSNVVFSIIEDRKERMWFSTVDGIRLYNKETKQFTYYENEPGNPQSLSNNHTFFVFEDSRGLIWAGTANGLNLLDEPTGNFTILRDKDGLADNRILTMEEDNNNTLWVSTTNGLSNIIVDYSVKQGTYSFRILNYDEIDGLQGKEFNEKASFKTSKGELIFGGGNGYNLFKPGQISSRNTDANIVFTDIQIFNKSYSNKDKLNGRYLLDKSISYSDNISLKYKENVFTIEFSNLNYYHPERSIYQYMLEGFNDKWIETSSNERKITYTNLNPGKYTFRVRVSNSDGSWNNKESSIDIEILPPWWKTIWFRIVMVLAIGSIIFSVYYFRFSQLQSQKKLLEEKVFERTNDLIELNTVLEERQEEISLQNEELSFHRHKLERLVDERTSDLEHALKKAEESDKLKSAFLANMSHEIRTPMNAIVGFSHLLRDEDFNETERNEYIDIIQKNCDSLLVIINDILDISKIESNQISLVNRQFDLIPTLKEIYSYYQLKNTKQQLEMYFENPGNYNSLVINTDEVRIRQVVQNLMDNALKFTLSGKIILSVSKAKTKDEITIAVKDSGFGINPKDYHKVFLPFSKIEHNEDEFIGGAGLGLAICKKIAFLMGGQINFDSEVNKGSTFFFTIPVEIINRPRNTSTERKETTEHKDNYILNVLIAEDEPANFYLLKKILTKDNVNVIWAKNGQEAVDHVQNHNQENLIILMDIKMPVLSGVEAFKIIRSMNGNIPIVAVTAYAYESEKLEILKNDFNDYISKPLKPSQIINTIEKIMNFKF